jgi:cation:H+ antiporter
MPESILWIGAFVISLGVLLFASERFIHAVEKIGIAYGIPSFILGVTIVAAGTSLPELVSSIIAVVEGHSEIVIGNVVGSNISNIFLILGIVAIYAGRIKLNFDILNVDLPLLVGSSFLMVFFVWDLQFSYFEAILSLVGLVIFLYYALSTESESHTINRGLIEVQHIKEEKPKVGFLQWAIVLISGFFIYLGADYTVESIVKLSGIFGIAENVIALSAVALGTSLPELIVSIMAARKGNPELAIGNILGSNIFNALAVMGIPAIVSLIINGEGLVIPPGILTFSLPLMVAATLIYFFIAQNNKISKWEGFLLLLFYVYYIGQLFVSELR